MPYLVGYFFIFVILLVPIAILCFIGGLFTYTVSSQQETQISALTGLFRIPILVWGFMWGIVAANKILELTLISPLLWLLIISLPAIGLGVSALIAENISERAEDKILAGKTVIGELIRAVVICVISILVLIPISYIQIPNR